MVETDIKRTRARAWVAGIVALACIQAWLSGTAHTYCVDAFSAFFAAIELELFVPIIGLCVAAYVGLTVAISSMRLLHWPTVAFLVAAYGVGASALLATLTTINPSRTWPISPVIGSAVAMVVIGLTVRRIPPMTAAVLGLLTAAACFAITFATLPFMGTSPCGVAP